MRPRALLLVAALLAGCASAPGDGDAPEASAGLRLACPPPCAVAIDAGLRWEPSVAADPTDPLHLVASSQDKSPDPTTRTRASWGLSHVSFDGGATWETHRLPGGRQGAPTHPLHRYNWMDDSAVAFLPDGTLLWSALVLEDASAPGVAATWSGMAVVVLRSTDGGRTFPDVAVVHEGQGRFVAARGLDGALGVATDAQDKQWLAIAPDGTALLAWSRNLGARPECASPLQECTQLLHATSRDGGRTWSDPRPIVSGGLYSGAFPLVRGDGGWVVSYRDTTRSEAHVARSTDEGASWTTTLVDVTTKFPVLATTPGPAGERLHMAYPRSDASHDEPQAVTLRWSDDGGATWSAPLTLDDSREDGRTIPALAPAKDGAVLLTWWHPTSDGAELRAAAVRDGTPTPHLVLDTSDGPTSTLGDYMGIAPLPDGSAYAVWNARHGDEWVVTGARLVVE